MEKNILELFLQYLHEDAKSPKTIAAYRTVLRQFFEWLEAGENIELNQLKPIDIKEYLSFLRHQKNRSQSTINKATATLKSFFNYLEEQESISTNPTRRIKIQRINQTSQLRHTDQTKWLSKEEQEHYLSYVELEPNEFRRLRNLAIIDLMLYVGLRVHEVSELKVHDLIIRSGNIGVHVQDGKGGLFAALTLVKKHSRNMRKWLRYRKAMPQEIYRKSDYLFVSERAGSISVRTIQKMVAKYGEMSHMEHVTPHRFRHSFCKNLANAGTPIEVIKRLARHEDVETTMIYIDSSYEEQMEALRKM